jgi:hypothetical protein
MRPVFCEWLPTALPACPGTWVDATYLCVATGPTLFTSFPCGAAVARPGRRAKVGGVFVQTHLVSLWMAGRFAGGSFGMVQEGEHDHTRISRNSPTERESGEV